jgi:hypothetical protein
MALNLDSSMEVSGWYSLADSVGIRSRLHVSGLCLTMEWGFFQHNKCCPRWIESLRGVRIVRGRTRRATNTGRTVRAVASANAERLAAPPSQLNPTEI